MLSTSWKPSDLPQTRNPSRRVKSRVKPLTKATGPNLATSIRAEERLRKLAIHTTSDVTDDASQIPGASLQPEIHAPGTTQLRAFDLCNLPTEIRIFIYEKLLSSDSVHLQRLTYLQHRFFLISDQLSGILRLSQTARRIREEVVEHITKRRRWVFYAPAMHRISEVPKSLLNRLTLVSFKALTIDFSDDAVLMADSTQVEAACCLLKACRNIKHVKFILSNMPTFWQAGDARVPLERIFVVGAKYTSSARFSFMEAPDGFNRTFGSGFRTRQYIPMNKVAVAEYLRRVSRICRLHLELIPLCRNPG